jgi:hypothetical protein
MIEQTNFLGLALHTRRQRRVLVVLYNLFLLLCSGVLLWKGMTGSFPMAIVGQFFILGGVLGGIKIGGPVKAYEELSLPIGGRVQTLNLEGRRPFDTTLGWPLDERERMQRDHAHYQAYRILRWTLCVAVVAYWLSLNWNYAWFISRGPVLSWTLLVYVLSLPQSVLLWIEPNEPVAELIELPPAPQKAHPGRRS